MENLQIFIFGEEIDLDAVIADAGLGWPAILEALAHSLDIAFVMLDGAPIATEFRLVIGGEDVDLEALATEVGYDWRPIVKELGPRLVAALPGTSWPSCFDPANIAGVYAPSENTSAGALAATTGS